MIDFLQPKQDKTDDIFFGLTCQKKPRTLFSVFCFIILHIRIADGITKRLAYPP